MHLQWDFQLFRRWSLGQLEFGQGIVERDILNFAPRRKRAVLTDVDVDEVERTCSLIMIQQKQTDD